MPTTSWQDTDEFERVFQNGSSDFPRGDVPKLVQWWIRKKRPGAVVRFGEGEARLFHAESNDPTSIRVACKKLYRQTGLSFSPKDMFDVKSALIHAFDEANVVGIKGDDSFREEHKMWIARMEIFAAARSSQRRKPAVISHCLISTDLYNKLPILLDGQRKISVISSRDLQITIAAQYGVEDVRVYQIPSQHIAREVDGDYEAKLHGVAIWPDFYNELYARINVRDPGEIFLVGAGLFGKDLCIRIRDLGGIALDLGSCLDRMAGKITRGQNAPHRKKAAARKPSLDQFL